MGRPAVFLVEVAILVAVGTTTRVVVTQIEAVVVVARPISGWASDLRPAAAVAHARNPNVIRLVIVGHRRRSVLDRC